MVPLSGSSDTLSQGVKAKDYKKRLKRSSKHIVTMIVI